ncbi:DUF5633 domain-containing protein [Anaerococcus hydrogenalis]|uniref:DUF5633 domain-containing protein n=1 Tax=Anaerococcus hydrogenalis TaxID=33029 RepID=UPI0023F3E5F0|nr:DUF5633 domain-containing protein [Anaerococcus hydrogenalis]
MKNSKKIIFASALTLALSVGTILPENVKADENNPTSSEEKVNDTVKLDLKFKLGNKDTGLKEGNNVADINGISNSIRYPYYDIKNYYAKRGTTLNIKVKNSSEASAKYYAEGTFEVPKEGYKDGDEITIILKEINKEETPVKPEDKKDESTDKKENDDKDKNVKPEDNKDNKDNKGKNTEVENKDTKDNISDNKEEKDKKEDKKNDDNKDDNKTENKNNNTNTGQEKDGKNKDSSANKGNGMGAGPLEKDPEFKAYATKEDAIEKAKEALKNNNKYNHYEIKTTDDGKYYYELSKKDKEDIKTVPVQQNNSKKVQTTNSDPKRVIKTSQSPTNVSGRVAKSNNVQTGVSSLTSIVAIASSSLAALILSKKNK